VREAVFLVVTGPRGCGKTRFCSRLAEEARSRGHRCGGILTRRTSPEGGAARDVEDIAAGQSQPLVPAEGAAASAMRRTYAWANEVLREAARSSDLLIVDELGALELEAGEGLSAALGLAGVADRSVYVVRAGLTEALLMRLGRPRAPVLHLGRGKTDRLVRDALALLFPSASEAPDAVGDS
jgi:nucleoside-triphosphatase THEP1